MYAYLTYTKIMQRYVFFFYYANISLIFNTFCKKNEHRKARCSSTMNKTLLLICDTERSSSCC